MNNRSHEQAIALAAVFQAATLVDQLARTGDIASDASDPLIKSLFEQSPAHFNDVYGDPKINLGIGLRQLQLACKRDPRGLNPDVTRYALSLLHLERKLFKSPAMISQLGQGIDGASRQAQHFSPTHENTVAALAGLYKQTLSNLSFRIRVTGNPTYLQNNYTANRVRALLLSGIRAAILWRQVGGKRWHLLTNRKHYLKACEELLNQRTDD
jgi:high frequency lysogenization protein